MSTQVLELIYGYPVPFANDAPDTVEIVDLLGGVIRVAVDGAVSGWTPAYAALKNSGVWNDSPMLDGRQLTAAAAGNVIETMSCIATGTAPARAAALSRLTRIIRAARDFHIEDSAYKPVYLRWRAAGGAGDQYALIYNIEVDVQQDPFGATDSNPLTLTIEREPFWRAIPPLDNPQKWPNPTAPADLISTTVSNYDERLDGLTTKNFIDIPAASIPGDADALAMVSFRVYTPCDRVWIARSTTAKRFWTDASARNCLNGVDAGLRPGGTIAAYVNQADGLWSTLPPAQRRVLQLSLGATATTIANEVTWFMPPDHGKYLVFVRGQLTSGSYSTLSTRLRVYYQTTSSDTPVDIATLPFTLKSAYDTVYAGILDTTPYAQMITQANRARGQDVRVELIASTVGGAAAIKVWDVVLIPFDECAVSLDSIKTVHWAYADGTGYKAGRPQDAFTQNFILQDYQDALVARGQMITLKPGQDNRLYFMFEAASGGAAPLDVFEVKVSIVPRWHGVRDV